MKPLLARALLNGRTNAGYSFQAIFEKAKYHGERDESICIGTYERQTRLYRHIQTLPHVQHRGKAALVLFFQVVLFPEGLLALRD